MQPCSQELSKKASRIAGNGTSQFLCKASKTFSVLSSHFKSHILLFCPPSQVETGSNVCPSYFHFLNFHQMKDQCTVEIENELSRRNIPQTKSLVKFNDPAQLLPRLTEQTSTNQKTVNSMSRITGGWVISSRWEPVYNVVIWCNILELGMLGLFYLKNNLLHSTLHIQPRASFSFT